MNRSSPTRNHQTTGARTQAVYGLLEMDDHIVLERTDGARFTMNALELSHLCRALLAQPEGTRLPMVASWHECSGFMSNNGGRETLADTVRLASALRRSADSLLEPPPPDSLAGSYLAPEDYLALCAFLEDCDTLTVWEE